LGNDLSKISGIKEYSFSTSSLSGEGHWGTIMSTVGFDDPNRKSVTTIMSDEKFCSLYGLKLKAGRFFNSSDTNAVSSSVPKGRRYAKSVVNEKLIAELGYPSAEASLGKRFWIGMNDWYAEIVGVVSDFNTSSLHEAIKPTLITQFL